MRRRHHPGAVQKAVTKLLPLRIRPEKKRREWVVQHGFIGFQARPCKKREGRGGQRLEAAIRSMFEIPVLPAIVGTVIQTMLGKVWRECKSKRCHSVIMCHEGFGRDEAQQVLLYEKGMCSQ